MKYILTLLFATLLVACKPTSAYESLDNKAFQEVLKQEGIQLLDVRTAQEYSEGHISNAISIDVNDSTFIDQVRDNLNKDLPIAVYCRSGRRSKKASDILVEQGYSVYELSTGMNGWLKDDLPVEK